MNYTVFTDILDQIHDNNIRNFTVECLKDAADEINTIPASISGKYHPLEATKEGGLIWHIQRACWFGYKLIESYQWNKDDIRGDIVLSALLLHDIGKKGHYAKYYEYVNHPKTAAIMIEKHKNMLDEKVFKLISGCVLHHMGPFGDKFWKKEISKYNILELMVYNADYLSSQKMIKVHNV